MSSSTKPALLPDDAQLTSDLRAGDRGALARAITLVESTRGDHQERAQAVLDELIPETGRSIRLGISGVPGVGKSTFIEALGMYLIERGHRLAVLAVDPSSTVTGGSILGDKTRMELLSQRSEAFIRPSPTSGNLGGVSAKTREAMLLCEAAGYNIIIVETVGVGQSETDVAAMTDCFVLIQLPNAGDDLQAIKKGVVELADIIVINKADIDPVAAQTAASQMKSALSMLHSSSPTETSHGMPPVLVISAARKEGIAEFWESIENFRAVADKSGEHARKRQHQAQAWMWQLIESGLRERFHLHPAVQQSLKKISQAVESGAMTPTTAAKRLLNLANETHSYQKIDP